MFDPLVEPLDDTVCIRDDTVRSISFYIPLNIPPNIFAAFFSDAAEKGPLENGKDLRSVRIASSCSLTEASDQDPAPTPCEMVRYSLAGPSRAFFGGGDSRLIDNTAHVNQGLLRLYDA